MQFTKMSGAGNDFVVVAAEHAANLARPTESWVREVCRRRFSVGADGVLVIGSREDNAIQVDFYNPDGSVAFCGNGSRCAARFAFDHGLAQSVMTLQTAAGPVVAEVTPDQVSLRLEMPLDRGPLALPVSSGVLNGRYIIAGVPHFVISVPDVGAVALEAWGPQVRRHEQFGESGSNLDIVARRRGGGLDIRTWERGVEGETLACGSGALAAAYCEWLETGNRTVRVVPASKIPIEIEFCGSVAEPGVAYMRGDARRVFEGSFEV